MVYLLNYWKVLKEIKSKETFRCGWEIKVHLEGGGVGPDSNQDYQEGHKCLFFQVYFSRRQ